ncbi:TIGR04282 family arsenosugar biosynthesis glycosyltransferase [Desulfosarcina sp.]|uniref:TIGR04282 family arsenosugar biosynthesis glycosyltransferase n=1 Tax=Desulfosarcina sp. TaxID=2027861 RepID=UPI0029A9635D|nr:TIGR04282 family arsenosugar biosynthesis glycosyltransferase [Desulfosarcina sp.]MDX2455392.1 TIGR04282 family arsenosugar biosynthesis glycosyltransferase [Desulfosarcina sp.]MDX2492910.1 TIGR04282 family arsenosugar biosynthesis glycosyltransferase [Desulfosarcina sp.]
MATKQEKMLLVVVAKAPVPGTVKTRLVPHLSPKEATDLYRCFLKDRITTIQSLTGAALAIAYTPTDARDVFTPFCENGLRLFPQKGKHLGERLNNIFVEKLADDFDAVCIIDSDTPDLPVSTIKESFERLMSDQTDVVFGPCYDGGYYLVGMRRPHPELFANIPWSTDKVLADTLERARELGVRADLLQRWNDLDTIDDLIAFYHLHKNKAAQSGWAGETTFNYLARMEAKSLRLSSIK